MIRKNFTHRWIEDVERIQKIFLDNGYQADLKDCADIWKSYSDDICAGWIILPEDDKNVWDIVKSRVTL